MIRAIAALALLTASAHSLAASAAKGTDALSSSAPWWEKVTVTIAGDGKAQSCRYETSLHPNAGAECDVTGDQAVEMAKGSGASNKSDLTRITFERRFTPGTQAAEGRAVAGRDPARPAGDGAGDRRRGQRSRAARSSPPAAR